MKVYRITWKETLVSTSTVEAENTDDARLKAEHGEDEFEEMITSEDKMEIINIEEMGEVKEEKV